MDIAAAMTALGWGRFIPVVIAISFLASAIGAIAPHATPGTWYAPVRKVIDLLSLAVGNARTATAPGSPVTTTTVPAAVPLATPITGATP